MANSFAPYPPAFIRRVLDDVANQGVAVRAISNLVHVRIQTVSNWIALAKIRQGTTISQEELDSVLRDVVTVGTKTLRDLGMEPEDLRGTTKFRELTGIQREYMENGYKATDERPAELTQEETASFSGVLTVVDRQLNMLEAMSHTAESIQEVTATLSAAIALRQLRDTFRDPPRVKDWREVKVVVDIAREALDMNRKLKQSSAEQKVGVDVNILSFNPNVTAKKTITLDAEIMDKQLGG